MRKPARRVTRALALQVIQAERKSESDRFSPTRRNCAGSWESAAAFLREAVKVLADKGMVAVRPRSGTRSRPRTDWNQLDPDILGWQSELNPDPRFLRDLV